MEQVHFEYSDAGWQDCLCAAAPTGHGRDDDVIGGGLDGGL